MKMAFPHASSILPYYMKSFFRPTPPVILPALALAAGGVLLFYYLIACALEGANGCSPMLSALLVPLFVFAGPSLVVILFLAEIFPVPVNIAIAIAVSFVWTYVLVCAVRWNYKKVVPAVFVSFVLLWALSAW